MRFRTFLVGLAVTSVVFPTLLAAAPGAIAAGVPRLALTATDEAWGSLLIDDGETYTSSQTVALTALLVRDDLAIDQLALSNDGVTWTDVAATELHGYAWMLTSGDGSKTVDVRWHDGATDQWSPIASDSIIRDATAPIATAPRHGLTNAPIFEGTPGVRISWTGADVWSGHEWYEVQQSVNGGTWVDLYDNLRWYAISVSSLTERTYRYRVRALDSAGNISPWATGDTFRVTRISDHNTRIKYSGTWTTTSSSKYWLGAAKRSGQAGARATLAFTGKSVAWVATQGATRGKAEVWVDGVKAATVDLVSAGGALFRQVMWTKSWPTKGAHTVQIRVRGTAGRPYVDVDAFVVLE